MYKPDRTHQTYAITVKFEKKLNANVCSIGEFKLIQIYKYSENDIKQRLT